MQPASNTGEERLKKLQKGIAGTGKLADNLAALAG